MTALTWPPRTDVEASAWLATAHHVPDMRTPAEVARDEWLESRAESRADDVLTGRDADLAADRYYGATNE